MTGDDVPQVSRHVLEPLTRVGDGGQGVVHFTDRVKINKEWHAAYKEYLPETSFDPHALRRMVAFVPSLEESSGRWLCDSTAWPAALVLDGSEISGFLMRRIPERFRQPWGDGGADVPAALQYLLNPQTYLDRRGIGLDEQKRLRLLEAIAGVMDRLHDLGIVVGDLSPNNLLVDLDDPACFFIDCDAMRLHGRDILDQVETPEWNVRGSSHEPIATAASDSYKFGLLAVRLFAQEQMGQDVTELDLVSGDLGTLARRSLDPNWIRRPLMAEWIGTLRSARTGPPARRAPVRHPVGTAPVAPERDRSATPDVAAEHPVFNMVFSVLVLSVVISCIVGLVWGIVRLF